MGHRYRVERGEGRRQVLPHESGNVIPPQGVGAVQHHERDACLRRRLHGVPHGGYVGIEAHACVLYVEEHQVEPQQILLARLLGGAVEAFHRYAAANVVGQVDPVLGVSLQAVLRREDYRRLHPFLFHKLKQVHLSDHGGVVGDQGELLSLKRQESLLAKDFGSRLDNGLSP